jgi:Domain of unknown function (DUF4350)
LTVGSKNAARAMAAAAILGVLTFLLLVQYAPDTVAFSPNNYGWDGLQGVASTYSLNFTTTFSSLPPRGVLVIIQPSSNYTRGDATQIRTFLTGGGTVLVADKSGVANSLLRALGSTISIQSQLSISDQTYNWKAKAVPTALVLPNAKLEFTFLSAVKGIALSQPSPLKLAAAGASDVAITSQFSSASPSTGSGTTSRGPFVVMAAQKFGNGTLLVVGDSQFLLNSEWTIANNQVLIGNLFTNTNVFVDASHWGLSSIAQLKAELAPPSHALSSYPARYILTALMVAVTLALVPSTERKESLETRSR